MGSLHEFYNLKGEIMIHSQYLEKHLDTAGLKLAIERTTEFLRIKTEEFDAIAFRGMSGALVAPSVAAALGKNLLMIRKEQSHSDMNVEGFYGITQRYVIVDDFISSGETCRTIIAKVKRFDKSNICIGIVLYNNLGRDRTSLIIPTDFDEGARAVPCWATDEEKR